MASDARAAAGSERYRFLRELGRGAMGVVDLVYDELRGAPVARKRMHQPSSETRFRIKHEFRQAQEVRHPNLVRLYDLFADDDDAFFTMEPVFGTDVASDVQAARARLGASAPELVDVITARLRQLVDAVGALHAAGIVHRDIKPTNALVEDNGRLVLLDFGFSSTLASDFAESEDHALVGTIPYMAPECLWGAPPAEGSDWYAVGVIAAELCLGRPLFTGSLQVVLRDKDRPPTTLRTAMPALPPALDELICSLLRRDPGARTTDPALVRAALGASETPLHVPQTFSGITSVFIGREQELAELERGIPREPRAQVVRVHGPSGIGKTALVRELTARLARRPSWKVFRGRCHPREHLALKALDSVMDEVSRHLKQLGPRACARLGTIEGMGALVAMFPVLTRVPELAKLELSASASPVDPQARWIDAVRAFRTLWQSLTELDRIAVWIDDLQWADEDGLKLLHEVIAVEPRAPITWIVSHRSAGSGHATEAAALDLDGPDDSFELPIAGLLRADATELAIRLGASRQVAGEVERESGGSPFIIAALTRAAVTGGELSSVERVLEDRLRALDDDALGVVEHLALADGPLPVAVLAPLLTGRATIALVLERLEGDGLVRTSYGGDTEAVAEAYHDRVREAVAARMSEASRRAAHLRLAAALEPRLPDGSRAAVAFHYRKAGALQQGLAHTLEAAAEHTQALAFGRAAQLYEEALGIHPEPTPVELLVRTAEALARAGRYEDAARTYLDAAPRTEAGFQRRTLLLQAGALLLQVGRLQEGRALLEAVLGEHGLRWPTRPLLTSMWERGRVLLGGAKLEATKPASPEEAEAFDAMLAVTKGITMVDPAVADAIALRSVREAKRIGDPKRLIWAVGHEAGAEAGIGGAFMQRHASALLREIERVAEGTGDPLDRAWVRMVAGIVGYFQGDCVGSEAALRDALRVLRQRQTEFLHEQNIVCAFLIAALEQQGDIQGMSALLSEMRAVARYTGNAYTAFLHRAAAAGLLALADDRPLDAIREADAALAAWPIEQFGAQHHYHFQVTLWARLYDDRAEEAWQHVERTWPALDRAHFLRMEVIGMQHRHLRARAALLALPSASGRQASRLRSIARADAATIGASKLPHAAPLAAVIDYGLALHRGDRERAREHCELAVAGFDRAGMALWREVARLQLASLRPDPELGRSEADAAHAWLVARGVRRPLAMARSLMPCGVPSAARIP